jgi:hypothetical protein
VLRLSRVSWRIFTTSAVNSLDSSTKRQGSVRWCFLGIYVPPKKTTINWKPWSLNPQGIPWHFVGCWCNNFRSRLLKQKMSNCLRSSCEGPYFVSDQWTKGNVQLQLYLQYLPASDRFYAGKRRLLTHYLEVSGVSTVELYITNMYCTYRNYKSRGSTEIISMLERLNLTRWPN